MGLSFPYPTMGSVRRDSGEGCSSCVHRQYCQAFYWFYRNDYLPSVTGKTGEEVDPYLGVQCNSWSKDEADRITTWNDDDLEYNDYYNDEGILREPFDSGLTEPTTGSDRDNTFI
jgi:hypothetical protein